MQAEWKCKKFDELNVHELYAILQLRSEVFVVEQQCVFLDTDNKDVKCHHVTGWDNSHLAAYARLVPPGIAYDEVSIGRVVTSGKSRRNGMGKILMQRCIQECHVLFGKSNIRIGAQLYLKAFYASFGFHQISGIYVEDGIEHIEMMLPAER